MGEENIIALSKKVEEKIQEQFKNVDNICQINSLKSNKSISRSKFIRNAFKFMQQVME